jgi:hypothetical protein
LRRKTNAGQTLVKRWSNLKVRPETIEAKQTAECAGQCAASGPTRAGPLSSAGQQLVKNWSKTGQTDKGRAAVERGGAMDLASAGGIPADVTGIDE